GISLENIQLMAAEDGVIDVGTLTLTERLAMDYQTVAYTTPGEIYILENLAKEYIRIPVRNQRTGEESTMFFAPIWTEDSTSSSYRARLSFGYGMEDFYQVGDVIEILGFRYENVCEIEPYTFTSVREGEQQNIPLIIHQPFDLSIKLDKKAYIYLFDSDGSIVYENYSDRYDNTLLDGTYTLICFAQNRYYRSISTPDFFESIDLDPSLYVKQTISLREDTELDIAVPEFALPNTVGLTTYFDTSRISDGLIPLRIEFSDHVPGRYDEGDVMQFEIYQYGSDKALPIEEIRGQYAYGENGLILRETVEETAQGEKLVITTMQPKGSFVVYARMSENNVAVQARSPSGGTVGSILPIEAIDVRMTIPEVTSEQKNTLQYIASLPETNEPYTALVYVNHQLQGEFPVNIAGEGVNQLEYKLEGPHGAYNLRVDIEDAAGNLAWTSDTNMVVYTEDDDIYVEPLTLKMRVQGGFFNTLQETFDLKNPTQKGVELIMDNSGAARNDDGTLTVDLDFDYALSLSNHHLLKGRTILMSVFCGADAVEPEIREITLQYNEETHTFDGRLTLEADTYTLKDLPYGYSFDYQSKTPHIEFDPAYYTASLEEDTERQIEALTTTVTEYYDPDALEFALENEEGLTEDHKNMFRTLIGINNDLFILKEKAYAANNAMMQELYGIGIDSDDLTESYGELLNDAPNGFEVLPVEEGVTGEELAAMGYEAIPTADGTLYLSIEQDGAATVVDLEHGLQISVSPNIVSQARRTRSAAPEGSGMSVQDAATAYLVPFLSAVHNMLDLAMDTTASVREYYTETMMKKLGLEGDVNSLKKHIRRYRDYLDVLYRDHLDFVMKNDLIGGIDKSMGQIAEEALAELQEIERVEEQIRKYEKNLKSLQADLQTALASINNTAIKHPNLSKYLEVFNFLDTKAGKVVSFI
ncbi:MAG: hypothetical protein IKU95_00050, partial [Clostridia bacterium]|nr:hypothetical protein [Clostridia bacterium]